MFLPDINVWLALAFEAHAHHVFARKWFEALGPQGGAFCRFTQQGFLRLATNRSVFGDEAVSMARAWTIYDDLLKDERVAFRLEPDGLEEPWRKHTRKRRYSHKVWSDAYLVAFAEFAGLTNVTFDRGYKDYKGTTALILQPS